MITLIKWARVRVGLGMLVLQLVSTTTETPRIAAKCDFPAYIALKQRWNSRDEPCQDKLPFELWTAMMAKSNSEPAALHVTENCLQVSSLEDLILSVTQSWDPVQGIPVVGNTNISSVTSSSAVMKASCAEDLQAMCDDDAIIKVKRVDVMTDRELVPQQKTARGNLRGRARAPQTENTKPARSKALEAHQVTEAIAALESMGCMNTMGEGQTLCIMSDSMNANGKMASLQAAGDLPPVIDIVQDFSYGSDEGAAMMELAFDIAPKANYKFNTAFRGRPAFAEDIAILAGPAHKCDIIVDDVSYFDTTSFRDDIVAQAVDTASKDNNILYFSSAGNYGRGIDFTLNLECSSEFFDGRDVNPCTKGWPTHVFDPESSLVFDRYFKRVLPSSRRPLLLQWDEDDGLARDLVIMIWQFDKSKNELEFVAMGDEYYVSIHQNSGKDLSPVDATMMKDSTLLEAKGGAMFGHPCASRAISVAAIDVRDASGPRGEFEDPEPSSVEAFSSRGRCRVRSPMGMEIRDTPTTTAADGLFTSSEGFGFFFGTSASAPVAAAIAALIRGACAPDRIVTHVEMMEMLADYQYMIDYTSDSNSAEEQFGVEAGHGIISALQMTKWIRKHCPKSCQPPAEDDDEEDKDDDNDENEEDKDNGNDDNEEDKDDDSDDNEEDKGNDNDDNEEDKGNDNDDNEEDKGNDNDDNEEDKGNDNDDNDDNEEEED